MGHCIIPHNKHIIPHNKQHGVAFLLRSKNKTDSSSVLL